ncbi:gasdermin-A-like isoform X1 [Rhincodon typus]|uniref:gasdermin-A-like isoform X1 n=2 Tax=Rhincodon typus TaxID=259920 RepID=UPI0009A3275C|nr:gasdermin-A-like isoform X1 [Rhincodon typus]XP_048470615.1 gasdermin-A-like isoform X1 [Rhincodon typus]XP_048470617.1 gasdermin-A-like isoform X1 [Rhincodon typus]
MFRKAVRHFIDQIDSGGGLIPATSAYDAERFKPLCLVYRKTTGPFWRKPKYCPTDFELKHILDDEDNLVSVQQEEMSFSFLETMDGLIKGKAKVSFESITGKVEGSKAKCDTIQLQGAKQLHISVSELIKSLKDRKVGPSWKLIKNSYSGDLCIVTETLMSVKPISLKKFNKGESKVYIALSDISKAGTECTLLTERTMEIPKGAVLAYKVWDLTVSEDDTLCLSVPKEKNQLMSWLRADSLHVKGQEGLEISNEFKCLENVLKRQLLDQICQIIEDPELHSILSEMLCDACAGIKYKPSDLNKLDDKGKECAEKLLGIWSEGQLQNAGENKLLIAVCSLVTALEDLPLATLQLLVESLKMQILPQQLDLVTNISKNLGDSQVGQILEVDTRGLSEAAFGITAQILNEIGIQMEREAVQKMRETSLCELSIALYCLEALSNYQE